MNPVSADLTTIMRLEVPIIIEIGARLMPVEALLSLVPGSIIELPKGIEEEFQIKVNNKAIGLGVAVKVGENFGVRIGCIGDLKTRINALAEKATGNAAADAEAEALAAQLLAGQF